MQLIKGGKLSDASNLNKAQRIAYIDEKLQALYPETPIPLDHSDPYTLLIAVLLSAQCTDERVNQVTPILFAKADCPEEMIRLSVEEIRSIIRPCGLSPQKSKAIHRLSELLLADHNGAVPEDLEALEKLPGVGHKTASVVMAQAFGIPTFPVDTHIHRLAARWGLSRGTTVERTEADLKAEGLVDIGATALEAEYSGVLGFLEACKRVGGPRYTMKTDLDPAARPHVIAMVEKVLAASVLRFLLDEETLERADAASMPDVEPLSVTSEITV